jgi:hypothetical protein
MLMKFPCYLAAVAAFVSYATYAPSSAAQPVPAPAPILNDLPANATLPSDGTFDLAGLALGMTFTEVASKYKEFAPDAKPKVNAGSAGISDSRGNAMNFAYERQATVGYNNSDGSREDFSAFFTTRINESRAVKVTRIISYRGATQQGSVPALIEGLNKKYGSPSYTQNSGRSIEISYIWFEGKRITLTNETARSTYQRGTPASCIRMPDDIGAYRFEPQRQDPRPGCTAVIVVKIFRGTRDDLIDNVTFEMADKVRYMKNGTETDAWLERQLREKIAGQSGAKAPKL